MSINKRGEPCAGAQSGEARPFHQEEEKVLSAFFADGRLKAMPARLRKRLLVLRRFAGLFEPVAV